MVYLDNNATTQIAKEALEAMSLAYDLPLNPSSSHRLGQKAKTMLYKAKTRIAKELDIDPDEVIFTSGGTESLNMLIQGLYSGKGAILSTNLEHSCVINSLKALEKRNVQVRYMAPKHLGSPTIEMIKEHFSEEISMIVLSAVYSETGSLLDVESIARFANDHSITLVIDGVALLGKKNFTIPVGVTGMGFSSHKLHGPTGVGACFVKKSANFKPTLYGGPQQLGKRAGTENLAGILGFVKALQLANQFLKEHPNYFQNLEKLFLELLNPIKGHFEINGTSERIGNTLNIYFKNISAESLMILLDQNDVQCSLGSACDAGVISPSKVLQAMGYPFERVQGSLRFSWSRYTTKKDLSQAAKMICDLYTMLTAD